MRADGTYDLVVRALLAACFIAALVATHLLVQPLALLTGSPTAGLAGDLPATLRNPAQPAEAPPSEVLKSPPPAAPAPPPPTAHDAQPPIADRVLPAPSTSTRTTTATATTTTAAATSSTITTTITTHPPSSTSTSTASPEPLRDLFPGPILYDLTGKDLPGPNCSGAAGELEACCSRACRESQACEFWVMDSSKGPCHLRHGYAGPALKAGARGQFKRRVSLDHILPVWPLEKELQRLREDLARPCPKPDWKLPFNSSRVEAWIRWALEQKDGHVQAFPEHDLLLSSKTCIDRELQVREQNPWYLLRETPENASIADPPPELTPKWEPRDMFAEVNILPFITLHKPSCPYGQGQWDYRSVNPPRSRWRGPGKRPPLKGTAVDDSDVWSNIGHALSHIAFLERAASSEFLRLPGQDVELVPSQGSFFFREEHQSPFIRLLFTALGLSEKEQKEVRFRKGATRPAPHCYNLVAQRFFLWPSLAKPYTLRERTMRHCAIPDRGLCRKMLFWFKKEAGHNMFPEHQWVVDSLGLWARSVGLDLRVTELSGQDVKGMTACQQVALFADLALYVGVHGAAGVQSFWLPQDAVYIEIAPEVPVLNDPKTSHFGYYGEGAALGGHLYLRYRHVVPVGLTESGVNKFMALDPRGLIADLDVIYSEWLRPRLAASNCSKA